MKGAIGYDPKRRRYYVSWYDRATKKTEKIWNYLGNKRIRFVGDEGKRLAEAMLSQMRGDEERGVFSMAKYKPETRTNDVVAYLETWLAAVKGSVAPGTYLRRRSALDNWLIPFFEHRNVLLHEIQYDVLCELAGSIKGTGEYRQSILHILHGCLRFARRANRIQAMPEFPETKFYSIVQKRPEWIPEERVDNIINHIPAEHQPIFWYLKLHLRRPGEVIVLKKTDLQDGVFLIQRGVSGYKEIDTPKDKAQHDIPIHDDMLPWLERERQKQVEHGIVTPYIFWNPQGYKEQRYTIEFLERVWKRAATECGETIDLYRGTKTSRAMSLVNDYGLSLSELMSAGDWKTMAAVKKYGDVTPETRKNLLQGKVRKMKEEKSGTKE